VPTREVSLVFRRDQWKSKLLNALAETLTNQIPAQLMKPSRKAQVLDIS